MYQDRAEEGCFCAPPGSLGCLAVDLRVRMLMVQVTQGWQLRVSSWVTAEEMLA